MTASGDQKVTAGVLAALRRGPLDVLGLLDVLRALVPVPLAGREGGVHAILQGLLRRGAIRVDGCTDRGVARYVLVETGPDAAPVAASPASPPTAPSPTSPFAKEATRMGTAVRDEADRARVSGDVAAHLESLATDPDRDFGSHRSARHYLRRVDRGRPTVCFAVGPVEGVKRFVLHEGPWLLAAVVVFFVVRAFLAEVFVIPSGSMIPTLLPDDRVIVVKPGGSGMPDRWRIVTFERRGITYVKRAVGLGGEALALVDGDVYVDGKIEAKPDDVREALRFPYQVWDLQATEDLEDWARTEEPDGGSVWTYNGPKLWSAGILHPRQPSRDVPLRDAYAALTVDRAAGETVWLEFEYGPAGFVDTGARTLLGVEVRDGMASAGFHELKEGEFSPITLMRFAPVPAGRVVLELSYVDGWIRARVGVSSWTERVEIPPGLVLRPRIRILEGSASRLVGLALDKDIHYSLAGQLAVPGHVSDEAPGSYAYPIPEGRVFFLGDNTHGSRDSRYRDMGAIPAEALIGPVSLRIWPLSRIGVVR